MKNLLSPKSYVRLAVLCCCIALLTTTLVGCQTAGKLVSVTESSVCPMCKTETRTAAIKGLTYTKHVCPGCRTITETHHYTGDVTSVVHVCDKCKVAVTKCTACASK